MPLAPPKTAQFIPQQQNLLLLLAPVPQVRVRSETPPKQPRLVKQRPLPQQRDLAQRKSAQPEIAQL
jgi:hypothetical protein